MPHVIAPRRHVIWSKILFGGQAVVCGAPQSQIRYAVGSALGEWLEMMQLQVVRLAAALTAIVDEAAAPRVALAHFAAHRCGNVPTAPARCRGVVAALGPCRDFTTALALRAPRIKLINSDHLATKIEARAWI